jgi:glycosyltransferase involved in cell wall biosynthesis
VNILFLSEQFFPHGGGAEWATYKYATMLSENGYNVTVVTNRFSTEPSFSKDKKMAIYRIPLFSGKNPSKFQTLFNVKVLLSGFFSKLFKWADIVYVPRFWFSAIPVSKMHHKPVLVHLHDYIVTCPIAAQFNFATKTPCQSSGCSWECVYSFERDSGRKSTAVFASTFLNSTLGRQLPRLITLSDGIICVSQMQRKLIVEKIPLIAHKIRVIYNPLPDCGPSKIEDYGYGFMGGSNPIKGFNVLHRSLNEINAGIHINVHAANFPTERKTEHLLHADLTYYKRLTGSSLDDFYKKVHAIVFPSVGPEPSPYVPIEALLKGRLVIASEIGGIAEIINGCKGAFFFESGNHKQLAEQIEFTYALNREVIGDYVAQSRETLLRKMDNAEAMSNFANFCEKLVT